MLGVARLRLVVPIIVTLAGGCFAHAESPTPLLRFPDIHGDTVVFVHGEDIWTAAVAGGPASLYRRWATAISKGPDERWHGTG